MVYEEGELLADKFSLSEEDVKNALVKRKSKSFTRLKVERSWVSHHAQFYLLKLTLEDKSIHKILAKKYVTPHSDDELVYALSHDANSLFTCENRNLRIIGNNVSSKLVPEVCGSSDLQLFTFMDYLGENNREDNLAKSLVNVTNQINSSGSNLEELYVKKRKTLMSGIKNLARFVGFCAAKETEINKIYDYHAEYLQEAERKEKLEEELLKGYLTRIYYANNSDCLNGEPYQHAKVKDLFKEQKSDTAKAKISLDERIRKISELKNALNERKWLQHGDYNVAHVFGEKVIDLEDFGYYSWTRDLSTFFMGGVDDISVPEGAELPHYLNFFLAYKHAFEIKSTTKNEDLVRHLDKIYEAADWNKITVDELLKIGAIENTKSYAEFIFSFFASAIEEGVHLDATLKRYDEKHLEKLIEGLDGYNVAELKKCKSKYAQKLFNVVADNITFLSSMIPENTNNVRNYFFEFGKLLNEMGIVYLEQSCLDKILGKSNAE